MNTLRSPHPARKQLEAFGVGRLPADECAAIEAHVAECDECCAVLLGVADDTIVRLAKESATKAFEPVKVSTATSPNETPVELRDHPRYRVLGLVGVGGMGAVYKAEHRLMERLVALKVIHGEFLQNRQAIERFTREVKAAARLAHSNIVTAFDAEHEGDLHFLVMEFVEGVSLDRYVAHQGPLSAPAAVRLIRQAAAGLDHAHQRGMVHRDIKPHNLMVKRTGELKILDFGLARFATGNDAAGNDDVRNAVIGADEAQGVDEGAEATRSDDERQRQRTIAYQPTSAGMILGTPDYLAPEQARDARSADIRSDIYSLGCTFFFLLTGRPPFSSGSTMATLKAHATRDPRAILASIPGIPGDVADILVRMLAKSPDDRFQTPAELLKALSRVGKNERATAAKSTVTRRPPTQSEASPIERVSLEMASRQPAAAPFELASIDLGDLSSPPTNAVPSAAAIDWSGERSSTNSSPRRAPGGAMSRRLAIGAVSAAVAVTAGVMLLAAFGILGGRNNPSPLPAGPSEKTVLLVVPRNDVWGPDYGPLRDRLRAQPSVRVVTASGAKGRCRLHADSPDASLAVVADETFDAGLYERLPFDAVVFIGADTSDYCVGGQSDATRRLIARAQRDRRIVGGLCLGQVVLAHHETLADREAAWGDLLNGRVAPQSARWNRERGVVVDRTRGSTVITGKSDAVVVEFADALLGLLKPS